MYVLFSSPALLYFFVLTSNGWGDVTDSGKTKKEVEREWAKRKGNLSFLSLHKTLSFLAWAVNIFRFRLRTVSDCESVTVTVTFAVTLCGISNDFFLKSRQSGQRREGS